MEHVTISVSYVFIELFYWLPKDPHPGFIETALG
jgi:hypothetical protein